MIFQLTRPIFLRPLDSTNNNNKDDDINEAKLINQRTKRRQRIRSDQVLINQRLDYRQEQLGKCGGALDIWREWRLASRCIICGLCRDQFAASPDSGSEQQSSYLARKRYEHRMFFGQEDGYRGEQKRPYCRFDCELTNSRSHIVPGINTPSVSNSPANRNGPAIIPLFENNQCFFFSTDLILREY